ncbi:hypothetical protein K440DRAFT_659461 [Wilcoxina mikolae CBS 423.85]|nr:hypothetical protein K440DRAFT_659461 [Wilcoxina mikolae CBS 423.85]
MSIRNKDSMYNPFKNWPFSASPSPVKGGGHPACSCPTDVDGIPFCPDGRKCDAGFTHGYPVGIDFAPPRQIPTVRITRPDENVSKPADKKTAIESLKACNSLRVKKESVKQKANGKEANSTGLSNRNVGSGTTVLQATNHKENENPHKVSSQSAPQDTHNMQHHTRVPMGSVANRSISMSTAGSSDRATAISWKNSSMASDSQTTLSSIEPEREPKGKEKAGWTNDSPESISKLAENTFGPIVPVHGPDASKDSNATSGSRGARKASGNAKMVLGCSQCLFDPKLKVVPCGCLICIECAGRFWGNVSRGSEVYCGCSERVWNMVGLETPGYPIRPGQDPIAQSLYSPSTVYSPASFVASPVSSTGAVQFSSPTPTSRYHYSPLKMERTIATPEPVMSAAHLTGNVALPPSMPPNPNATNMSNMLMMDAETAIRNAPFVDLGRNSLPQNWSCVKIGNIPYNVSSEDLLEFLGKNSNIVPEAFGSIGVHVIMDRSTGKTMDAYVEFLNAKDAWKCVSRRRSRILGNRHLSLDIVDPAELMKDVFPRAKGIVWDGVVPSLSPDKSEFGAKTEIISREELVLIVNHARTPHRSLMSIVSKFPWFAIHLYTIQQRDYIYQALLSAIDILKRQIKRGRTMPNLDLDLLKSLLHVGIRCSGFTDTQKYELVKTAEFGAEGIRVDADINILSGFEALGKAVGAERKVLEFYALLLELSVSPFLSEPSSQGLAAADLIRSKNTTKQPPEESKTSYLTMAEASAMEWATVEKAVRTVLPGKLHHAKNLKKCITNVSLENHGK